MAAYIGIETISYKYRPSLKEPIDITFIENSSVVFESIGNKETLIFI